MMWNWRMLAASDEARFTEVIERALYNGINSGMSLDGTIYCYRNPLAFDPASGDKIRNPWYDTTCCPPNLERTFASLPGYFYSTSKGGSMSIFTTILSSIGASKMEFLSGSTKNKLSLGR